MLRLPEHGLYVVKMLDAFKDVPVSLKNILLRPFFVDSRETTDTIQRLNRLINAPMACDFLIFNALLGHMTLEEKARHLAPLVEMFKSLLSRYQSLVSPDVWWWRWWLIHPYEKYTCVSNFLKLYVEAVQGAENDGTSGELVRFVEFVRRTIFIKGSSLLSYMDPNALDYLLSCFSDERFDVGWIMKSVLLKNLFFKNEILAVLIRHGFKYSFQQEYYFSCGFELNRHRLIPHPLFSAFMESGNLRMQMAADILACLLFEGDGNREFLCTLWQSVPYPFITPDELHHLMEPFFVRQGRFVRVLVYACALYQELIPGVPRVKEPRSLKHLARVRIRESMIHDHSIREKAVRSLGLPKLMEDYLWKLEAF